MNQARYSMSKIEDIRKELELLPEVEPGQRSISKQASVQALLGEIRSLAKRGYSLERISTLLGDRGLEVSAQVLRVYLRKSKKGGKKPAVSAIPADKAVAAHVEPRINVQVREPVTKVATIAPGVRPPGPPPGAQVTEARAKEVVRG